MLLLDDKILKLMLIVCMPVIAVIIFVKKLGGDEDRILIFLGRIRIMIYGFLVGFFVGGYDGIFGPGRAL